jgi:hypothetical protein
LAEYLIIGAEVWQSIFKNTLFIIQNRWIQVKGGPDQFWVDNPLDNAKFYGLFAEDECGQMAPLYYDAEMSVAPKPTVTTCKCGGSCGCGGLCGELNNFSVTTTPVVIAGQTYYKKQYLKYCGNGAIYEYTETPTQKFLDKNQAGDYNNDYNSDYSRNTGFQNYEIVFFTSSKLHCQLDTLPCGCPAATQTNEEKFFLMCGCHVVCWNNKRYCNRFMEIINPNCRGTTHFSENGRQIIIRQRPNVPKPLRIGDWIQIRYQTTGINAGSEIIMPEYARNRYYAGLQYEFMVYKDRYSQTDKDKAREKMVMEDDNLFLQLNRLQMQPLAQIQDFVNRW